MLIRGVICFGERLCKKELRKSYLRRLVFNSSDDLVLKL